MDGDMAPDTDTPMTFVEMAAALERIGKPAGSEVPIAFDADDYPLFAEQAK